MDNNGMNTTPRRSAGRRFGKLLGGLAGVALFAPACGGAESLTENAFENILEEAVEQSAGDEVDFEFNTDSANGEFSLDFGGQTISVDSESGTVDFSGFGLEGQDGEDSFSIQASEGDNGTVVTEWEDGDGSSGFSAVGTVAPDTWPAELSPPEGAFDVGYIESGTGDSGGVQTMTFSSAHTADDLFARYEPYFSDWESTGELTFGDADTTAIHSRQFARGDMTATLQLTVDAGEPIYATISLLTNG